MDSASIKSEEKIVYYSRKPLNKRSKRCKEDLKNTDSIIVYLIYSSLLITFFLECFRVFSLLFLLLSLIFQGIIIFSTNRCMGKTIINSYEWFFISFLLLAIILMVLYLIMHYVIYSSYSYKVNKKKRKLNVTTQPSSPSTSSTHSSPSPTGAVLLQKPRTKKNERRRRIDYIYKLYNIIGLNGW
jgi:predicted membrane protein